MLSKAGFGRLYHLVIHVIEVIRFPCQLHYSYYELSLDLYIGKLSVVSQPQSFFLWPKIVLIYADAYEGSVISYRTDFVLNKGPTRSPMDKDCTKYY